VKTVSISGDSWRVASAGEDGSIRTARSGVTGVSYGPFGDIVVSCGKEGALKVIWDPRDGLFIRNICQRDEQLLGCCVSPDGLRVALACDDGVLRAYDVDRPDASVLHPVSPDGLRVALACDDGVLRAYDVDRPDAVITQRHSFAPFSAVTYAPSGLSIATGSDDGTVKMWDASNASHIAIHMEHAWTVKMWDASNGDMKAHFLAHIRLADEEKRQPNKALRTTGQRMKKDGNRRKHIQSMHSIHAHIRPADEGRRQPKKAFPVHALCYDKSSTKLVSCSADGTLKEYALDQDLRYWLRMVKEEGGMMGLATSLEKREIKRKRLTSQMMTHRTEEMPIDDRIARQKRKDRERKKTLASRQERYDAGEERYDAGEDPDNFTDDSEDSLLTEEDLHQIAFDLEEEDGDLLQQSASATPQDWKLVCTLKGHSMPVLDAKFNHAANVGHLMPVLDAKFNHAANVADFGHEESIRVLLDNHEDNEHDAGFDRGTMPYRAHDAGFGEVCEGLIHEDSTMPYRAHDAGFGGVCEGLIHNNCLVIIDLRSGPVRSLCVTGDDAILVAVADGLRREDGGLISYWDARAYCRVPPMPVS
ncbi:WD40-repeat-containing domain protein, partial [Baffinella frigidus]